MSCTGREQSNPPDSAANATLPPRVARRTHDCIRLPDSAATAVVFILYILYTIHRPSRELSTHRAELTTGHRQISLAFATRTPCVRWLLVSQIRNVYHSDVRSSFAVERDGEAEEMKWLKNALIFNAFALLAGTRSRRVLQKQTGLTTAHRQNIRGRDRSPN